MTAAQREIALSNLDEQGVNMATIFAAAAYVVISCARYSDDGGSLGLLTALSGVFVLALELLWKSSPLLIGAGVGRWPLSPLQNNVAYF